MESFPWVEPARGRPARYPWGEWLSGDTWMIRQHEDFDVSIRNMRVQIGNAARRRGCRARIHANGGMIVFRAERVVVSK